MDRLLLDSNWNNGYPLCLETLQLLQNNVQLLETVLNGLNLPQHTIVRFPTVNGAYFAYVKPGPSISNSLLRGEILQIGSGGTLDNGDVSSYSITATDVDIEDSNHHPYPGVYQIRRLNLISSAATIYGLKVVNFDEVIELSLWKEIGLSTTPYRNRSGVNVSSYVTGDPVIDVKKNDRELRIRICLTVDSLPIENDSEFRIVFSSDCFDNCNDVIPIWACFNGNDINKHVSADVCEYNISGRFMVKIFTHELYDSSVATAQTFTGQITVNAVIAITPAQQTTLGPTEYEIG